MKFIMHRPNSGRGLSAQQLSLVHLPRNDCLGCAALLPLYPPQGVASSSPFLALRGVNGYRRTDMGILPYAQSCSSDCSSEFGGEPGTSHRRGALPLHSTNQLSREMAGLSVAGAFCFLCDGRAIPAGGGAVRGIESSASWFGVRCRRLALEQCKGTSIRARRPLGAHRSDAGDGRRLAWMVKQRDLGRRTAGFARTRPHWASVRKRHVCGPSGACCRSYPPSTEGRSPVKIAQTSIIGACRRTESVRIICAAINSHSRPG